MARCQKCSTCLLGNSHICSQWSELTFLRRGQLVAGFTRWLSTHWRAAKVICLHFTGYPADKDWEARQPVLASAAGCARVLRVTSSDPILEMREGRAGRSQPLGLPGWVAGVLPLCQNLTALHLRRIELVQVPALPLLVHLILEECVFRPALVASLQGLARLETLHVSGSWASKDPPVWDVRACTRLRRVFMGCMLAYNLEKWVQGLCMPPACTVALSINSLPGWHQWLVQLGRRLAYLRIEYLEADEAMTRTFFLHSPELTQLQHVTLIVARPQVLGSLCVARLLNGLPQCVKSLDLECPVLLSGQAVAVVPASLRALRVESLCDQPGCRQACCCALSERTQDLTFGLHAGLERLCLVLWGVRVGLHCLDAGAPAGLHELMCKRGWWTWIMTWLWRLSSGATCWSAARSLTIAFLPRGRQQIHSGSQCRCYQCRWRASGGTRSTRYTGQTWA